MIFTSLQNITLFEKNIYIQLVIDNCFILQALYLSYTSYFYTLCLLFISDCDLPSLIEVNFLLPSAESYWILGELLTSECRSCHHNVMYLTMWKFVNYDYIYGFDVSHRIFVPIEVDPWTFAPLLKVVP